VSGLREDPMSVGLVHGICWPLCALFGALAGVLADVYPPGAIGCFAGGAVCAAIPAVVSARKHDRERRFR
jgi:hypothetical protein